MATFAEHQRRLQPNDRPETRVNGDEVLVSDPRANVSPAGHVEAKFQRLCCGLSKQPRPFSCEPQTASRHAMNLGEQFRSNVFTVEPSDPISHAVWKMKDENIGAVVVVKDRKVVGILTDRDVALHLALETADPSTPVEQIMTKDVKTIWEDQGVFNATQYMMGHHMGRLPIINRQDELVGMVTMDDIFALVVQELRNLSQAVSPSLADKVSW